MSNQAILVTGAAGFIGYYVARRLMAEGRRVVGLDNLNAYYDPALKQARLDLLLEQPGFEFVKVNLADSKSIRSLFARHDFTAVVHLAAQAGVRYSIKHPHAYVEANLEGFVNILEACRHSGCRHLIYASSSSVYGANTKLPFSVADQTDHPVSLYAATKKANELMAYCYSHLYGLPVTGLRFFTVYGPWMRPDMAVFLFAKAIVAGEPIKVFNHGKMRRDFTYIDDVCHAINGLIGRVPEGDPTVGAPPARLYNIGNSRPEDLMHVVALLESELGRKAIIELLPMQPGDVVETFADVEELTRDTGFSPSTTIEAGIARFAAWYRDYYEVSGG